MSRKASTEEPEEDLAEENEDQTPMESLKESKTIKGTQKEIVRDVILEGTAPLMFDRYAGDNDTKLSDEQKVNVIPGTQQICLPAINIISFLSAENTPSVPKVLLDPRKYKRIARSCLNYVSINPDLIPILRDGSRISIGSFKNDFDPVSGMWIHRCAARLPGGIPNPKVRPVLPLPWTLEFRLTIVPNEEIQEKMVQWLFEEGGKAIGFGTFRGVFGKFRILKWE